MRSSFLDEDVILLLKDITDLVEPLPTEEREKRIQRGAHYSEMLPLEYRPTEAYLEIYEKSLALFGQKTADAVAKVSESIVQKKGEDVVLVSLARAGTPIGILIGRYIRKKYHYDCPHYSISIIRDKGIDNNAMEYILNRHSSGSIQFVDGWTGKGTINKELKKALKGYEGVSDDLAVLADPAHLTATSGTYDDILIPSSCLNSTICGLISRTFYRTDIIGKKDFHGAAFYESLREEDRTYEFIEYIEKLFSYNIQPVAEERLKKEGDDIERIRMMYNIKDVNYIKPGIGETTRVLLRRIPWRVIINSRYKDSFELNPIKQLTKEKGVIVDYMDLHNYKCCGVIKKLTDI